MVYSEAAEISYPAVFTGIWAWFQAFLISAVSVSAVFGFPVDRPLEFGHAFGRVERWQSPVDRARLEIV